jgi:NADH dehydrogenase
MKIAVTGAFSYSGKYITRRLLDRGEQVITLTRHPNRPDLFDAARGRPFDGAVSTVPLDFTRPDELAANLRGAQALVNTYWIRYDRGVNTHRQAVENTRTLVRAAAKAGVQRIVHLSVTKPAPDSHLPYYWGKAATEEIVRESGLDYAILRPTLIFGNEDILINNIAWLLRRFPFFAIPGDGKYLVQPVYVDDLAALVVQALDRDDSFVEDAIGPDILAFDELVQLLAAKIGRTPRLVHVPPRLALGAAQVVSLFVRDVMLTQEEVDGLLANLLVSEQLPNCPTCLADWLEAHRDTVGTRYASELERHYD